MGTTLLDRLKVEVALLAFGLRRLPMGFPPVISKSDADVALRKKTGNGNAGGRFHRLGGVQK
jgi:hypothetical protein